MGHLKISKRIPAHTKTLTARWCRKDWMEMSQQYRNIRGQSRKPMDKCYWCKTKFNDGDMMALAAFTEVGVGNQVLCPKCADELLTGVRTEQ